MNRFPLKSNMFTARIKFLIQSICHFDALLCFKTEAALKLKKNIYKWNSIRTHRVYNPYQGPN